MGVVSGVVMSYEFGTNWAVFSDKAGPVVGPLMGYEVLTAFFLEAGFLGVMLFGLSRVPKPLHFAATCLVALGHAHQRFLDPVGELMDADAARLHPRLRRTLPAGGLVGGHFQPILPVPASPTW